MMDACTGARMRQPAAPTHCPFCHSVVAPTWSACKSCHASRHGHQRMSLASFTAFFAVWASCVALLMLGAIYVALVPWLPYGETPDYALTLLGMKAAPV